MSRFLDKQLAREAHRGRSDRVAELIARGADVNKLASDGFTPLMHAAYQGHHELVRLLLQHAADPNATANDGASALYWACVRGHEIAAETLILAGANVNAARDGVYTVLHALISNKGSSTLVQVLIRNGASLDQQWHGMSILQYAQRCGRPDLVPLLTRNSRA
jgi:ankyrin repeat protein